MKENLLTFLIHYDLLRSPIGRKYKSHSLHQNQTKIYLQYQQINHHKQRNTDLSQKDLLSSSNNLDNKNKFNGHNNRTRTGSLQKINKIKNHFKRDQASSTQISKKKSLLDNKDNNNTQNFLNFVKKNKQKRRNYTQVSNIYIVNPLVKQLANKNHDNINYNHNNNLDSKNIQEKQPKQQIHSLDNRKFKNKRKNINQTTKSLLQSPSQYQQNQHIQGQQGLDQDKNQKQINYKKDKLLSQCPQYQVAKNIKEFSMKQLVLASLKTNIDKFKSQKEDIQKQQAVLIKGSFAYSNQNIKSNDHQSQKGDQNVIKYFKSVNTSIKTNEDINTNINEGQICGSNNIQNFGLSINNKTNEFNTSPKGNIYKQFKNNHENEKQRKGEQKYCALHHQKQSNLPTNLNTNIISEMIKYRQKIDRYKQKKSRQYEAKNTLGIKIIKVQQKSVNPAHVGIIGHRSKQNSGQKQKDKLFSSLQFSGQMNPNDSIISPQNDIFQFNDGITKVPLKLLNPLNKKGTTHQDQNIDKNPNSSRSISNENNSQLKLQLNSKLSHQLKKQRQQLQKRKLQKNSKQNKNQQKISSGFYCLCLGSQDSQKNPKIIITSFTSQKANLDSPKMKSLLSPNNANYNTEQMLKSKLRSNNSIVLNSFNCFMMKYWQVQQKQKNQILIVQNQSNFYDSYKEITKSSKKDDFYYYYVGSGNNQQLIVQIMKKRKGWKPTNNIQKANFVWTQLKINELFKKQQFSTNIKKLISESLKILKYEQKNQKSELNLSQHQTQLSDTFHSNNKLKKILKQLQRENQEYQKKILRELAVEKQLIYISNQKKKEQLKQKILLKSHENIKKLYHQSQIHSKLSKIISNSTSLITTILSDKIKINEDSTSNQQNVSKKAIFSNPIFEPNFIHNHFQHSCCIGNKKQLLKILSLYEAYSNKKITQKYLPLSFHLQTEQDEQYKKLTDYINCQKSQNKQKQKSLIWILKPGQNTNRGHGIMLTKSLYQIKNILRQKSQSQKQQTIVVQKYLTKVFLYQKRKFDIRVYMLILTINNQTKYFFYEEGYIRTSSFQYNLDDLDDVFVHLTNDAVQQRHEKYSYYEKGNKLSYHEFQKYLDFNYAQQNYSMSKLHKKMKSIVTDIAKASYFKINKSGIYNNNQSQSNQNLNMKSFGFQLFGLDFIIDHKFKPWLLEVNTNPCLQLKSPILQRLIPRMLENMFRLCLDPLFVRHLNKDVNLNIDSQFQKVVRQSSANLNYQNILQINRWQLIHDSLYDRDKSWQQFYMRNKTYKKSEQESIKTEFVQKQGEQIQSLTLTLTQTEQKI